MSFCVFASPRPCGAAEQRKEKGHLCTGKCRERKAGDPLFPRASFSALRREAESQAGGLPFLLGPFLWASKEKNPRARGGRMDDDDGCCPKTITEVIKHTGLDAYTQKTETFKQAMNFMTAHQGWVDNPYNTRFDFLVHKEPKNLRNLWKVIAPIYQTKKPIYPTIVQYFSPLTQDEKYEQGIYSKNSQMTDQEWTTKYKDGQLVDGKIPEFVYVDKKNIGLADTDDFRFYQYSKAFKAHMEKQKGDSDGK